MITPPMTSFHELVRDFFHCAACPHVLSDMMTKVCDMVLEGGR